MRCHCQSKILALKSYLPILSILRTPEWMGAWPWFPLTVVARLELSRGAGGMPGEYQVTLTWTDDDGDEAVLEFTIYVVRVDFGERRA